MDKLTALRRGSTRVLGVNIMQFSETWLQQGIPGLNVSSDGFQTAPIALSAKARNLLFRWSHNNKVFVAQTLKSSCGTSAILFAKGNFTCHCGICLQTPSPHQPNISMLCHSQGRTSTPDSTSKCPHCNLHHGDNPTFNFTQYASSPTRQKKALDVFYAKRYGSIQLFYLLLMGRSDQNLDGQDGRRRQVRHVLSDRLACR